MNRKRKHVFMTVLGGADDSNVLILGAVTTGAQTLTLQRITPTGGTCTVSWGDGTANSTIANGNTGTTTHNYAGAGTYVVRISNKSLITYLDLRDTKLTWNANASPPPVNLTTLYLNALTGLTYNANTDPLPSGLTSLTLVTLTGLTYNANTDPLPSGLTYLYLQSLTGLTYNANTDPLPSGLTTLYLSILTGLTYNANTDPLPSGLTSLYLINLTGLTYNANTDPLPSGLTSLTLNNLTGLTYNANTDPLPSGLTYLYLNTLTGLTYNANTDPLPSGLTYLYLNTLAGLTWEINASQPFPTGATACLAITCPNVTVSAWTDNAIRSIQLENAYNAAAVDAVLAAIWTNKANFTYATPTLDLLGGSNAAPNGVYQAASPPTTGNEYKYDLVNGSYTADGPEWTVTTA